MNFIFLLEKTFCLPKIISWISIWEILHNGKSNVIGIQETWVFTLVSWWLLFIIYLFIFAFYYWASSLTSPELYFLISKWESWTNDKGADTQVFWLQGSVVVYSYSRFASVHRLPFTSRVFITSTAMTLNFSYKIQTWIINTISLWNGSWKVNWHHPSLAVFDDTVFIEIPQYGIYLKEVSRDAAKYSCSSIIITILIIAKNG